MLCVLAFVDPNKKFPELLVIDGNFVDLKMCNELFMELMGP